jgi:hypothetical protein
MATDWLLVAGYGLFRARFEWLVAERSNQQPATSHQEPATAYGFLDAQR